MSDIIYSNESIKFYSAFVKPSKSPSVVVLSRAATLVAQSEWAILSGALKGLTEEEIDLRQRQLIGLAGLRGLPCQPTYGVWQGEGELSLAVHGSGAHEFAFQMGIAFQQADVLLGTFHRGYLPNAKVHLHMHESSDKQTDHTRFQDNSMLVGI
jgi:hypothetical protein